MQTWWWALLGLLILPGVSGGITLEQQPASSLNFGDEVHLGGFILHEKDLFAYLSVTLVCGESQQLLKKSVSLKAHVQKTFSEELPIPFGVEGNCVLRVALDSQGGIVDSVDSSGFTITKALHGSFSVDKQQLQLGDSFTLTGAVQKQDGSTFDGVAAISLQQGNLTVYTATETIEGGQLNTEISSSNVPAGTYVVSVRASDMYGNSESFSAASVTFIGGVTLSATLDQATYSPGERLTIAGSVQAQTGSLGKTLVTYTFLNESIEERVFFGSFSQSFLIPETITTGSHEISVSVFDDFGNTGAQTLGFSVPAVPTTLDLSIDKEEYLPSEDIALTATLFDQAHAFMAGTVAVSISDPKTKDPLFSEEIASGGSITFSLDENAVPGNYFIKASVSGLSTIRTFFVTALQKLAYALSGTRLIVTNIGNSAVKKEITIYLESEEIARSLVKNINLDVQEQTTIELGNAAPPGPYHVKVGEKAFEIVIPLERVPEPIDLKTPLQNIGKGIGIVVAALLILGVIYFLFIALKKYIRRRPPRPKKALFDRRLANPGILKSSDSSSLKSYQSFASTFSFKKKPMKFSFKKQHDTFVYELPQKRERKETLAKKAEDKKPTFTPWLSMEDFRKEVQEEQQQEKREKKGLFNMFG